MKTRRIGLGISLFALIFVLDGKADQHHEKARGTQTKFRHEYKQEVDSTTQKLNSWKNAFEMGKAPAQGELDQNYQCCGRDQSKT